MDLSDGVLLVLTASSVGVAIYSLGHARRATEAAAGAVLEAKSANTLARSANALAQTANTIAAQSNTIAAQAAQDARDAPTSVAWDELLVAVAAISTFDPTDPKAEAGPLLTSIRTRAMLLIDKTQWEHFDKWVSTEQLAGVLLLHEAADQGEREYRRLGKKVSPDQAMEILERFHLWAVAYQTNLRMARKTGPEGVPFEELTAIARKSQLATAARNGWPEPPDKMEGLEPFAGSPTS